MTTPKLAIVAGAGGAIGPSILAALAKAGYHVVAIARQPAGDETVTWIKADLADPAAAANAYSTILDQHGAPSVVIYNAHKFLIQPFADISAQDFEAVWRTDTLGAFVTAKSLIPAMLENGGGTMIFSGATASLRGSGGFSAFASAKFALRGLAQSLAREYGPLGLHVAHVIIDGIIFGGHAQQLYKVLQDDCIDPRDLAESYMNLIAQPQSTWSQEIDVRPFNAKF